MLLNIGFLSTSNCTIIRMHKLNRHTSKQKNETAHLLYQMLTNAIKGVSVHVKCDQVLFICVNVGLNQVLVEGVAQSADRHMFLTPFDRLRVDVIGI